MYRVAYYVGCPNGICIVSPTWSLNFEDAPRFLENLYTPGLNSRDSYMYHPQQQEGTLHFACTMFLHTIPRIKGVIVYKPLTDRIL